MSPVGTFAQVLVVLEKELALLAFENLRRLGKDPRIGRKQRCETLGRILGSEAVGVVPSKSPGRRATGGSISGTATNAYAP